MTLPVPWQFLNHRHNVCAQHGLTKPSLGQQVAPKTEGLQGGWIFGLLSLGNRDCAITLWDSSSFPILWVSPGCYSPGCK